MKEPILFIIFNRPSPTTRVFESIKNYKPQKLYIAADGPRINRPGEDLLCATVRSIIKIDWVCDVKYLYREKNLGCKVAVSSAIDWFFQNEERGIILEDDCLPHQSFFSFCEDMLSLYDGNSRISHIGGYSAQNGRKRGDYPYFFMRYFHVWGWASWRRAWKEFDVNMMDFDNFKKKNLINAITRKKHIQRYWLSIFDLVRNGKIDTWDYQWVYANFKISSLAICPNENLIENIGFGEDATHTKGGIIQQDKIGEYKSSISKPKIEPCIPAENYLYRSMIKKQSVWTKIKRLINLT